MSTNYLVVLTNQQIGFTESLLEELLIQLSLSAKLNYIVPGGFPIPFLGGYISVTDGRIINFVEDGENKCRKSSKAKKGRRRTARSQSTEEGKLKDG